MKQEFICELSCLKVDQAKKHDLRQVTCLTQHQRPAVGPAVQAYRICWYVPYAVIHTQSKAVHKDFGYILM
jgi:hypothetical protein